MNKVIILCLWLVVFVTFTIITAKIASSSALGVSLLVAIYTAYLFLTKQSKFESCTLMALVVIFVTVYECHTPGTRFCGFLVPGS